MNILLIIAIISLLIGAVIRYWIYQRKFYRRNSSGLEAFSSYEKSVFTKFFELILKWISYIFIIISLLYLWRYARHSESKSGISVKIELTK